MEAEVSGSPLPGWLPVAGCSYVDTEYLEAAASARGQPFSTYTPRHSVNLWMRYAFEQAPLAGWSVGGVSRQNYYGARRSVMLTVRYQR